MITLYGIKNCDTIKKARCWLDARRIPYRFHDYRIDGLAAGQVRAWVKELGWEALLNTRGTTWRQLPPTLKGGVTEARAVALMLKHPALIKRPLLDLGAVRVIGFDEATYARHLSV
jgi:arsenate reductase